MAGEALDISQMIATFAKDAVETQEHLDAAYEQELDVFAKLLASAPPEHRELLLPLAPLRTCMGSFRMSAALEVQKSLSAGVSLTAKPINLAYEMTYKSSRTSSAKITIDVEAVPVTSLEPND